MSLVESISKFAGSMGMMCVVEGVEHFDQVIALRSVGLTLDKAEVFATDFGPELRGPARAVVSPFGPFASTIVVQCQHVDSVVGLKWTKRANQLISKVLGAATRSDARRRWCGPSRHGEHERPSSSSDAAKNNGRNSGVAIGFDRFSRRSV